MAHCGGGGGGVGTHDVIHDLNSNLSCGDGVTPCVKKGVNF